MKTFLRIDLGALILTISLVTGCGFLFSDDLERYDELHEGKLSAVPAKDSELKSELNLEKSSAITIPEINCSKPKSDLEFASSVIETLYGRQINEDERKAVKLAPLDRESFVTEALENSEADSGYTKFVTNLFQLSKISSQNNFNSTDLALIGFLKQEPVIKVLRNIDKPWSYFFTFKKFYCTPETAALYGIPAPSSSGFEECEMPDDRAGFLGLASVLRSHPSSMFQSNNNYHRVAFTLYLALGVKLLDSTDGPSGEEKGLTLADCVPKTDMRVMADGLIYGTAAIPANGGSCASCHVPHNGPLSVAFRRFDQNGRSFSFDDIDRTSENTFRQLGMTRGSAKYLLNELDSCWAPNGEAVPKKFRGVPGLGRIIAESGTLGTALSIQVPQNLGNVNPDANMKATIRKTFEEGEGTLKEAIKGFFMSDSYQCALKAKEKK